LLAVLIGTWFPPTERRDVRAAALGDRQRMDVDREFGYNDRVGLRGTEPNPP